jgi:hypothetical protein
LEKEEEKAIKRIEDARKQALSLIKQKVEKDQYQKKIDKERRIQLQLNQK